mmetsp:Transcript_7846/g.21389  ORF Transcript_7846/g.21389 Transcript_7846/m.21389 type:complete len:203 (+) Transcript_7846:3255-3863(+)
MHFRQPRRTGATDQAEGVLLAESPAVPDIRTLLGRRSGRSRSGRSGRADSGRRRRCRAPLVHSIDKGIGLLACLPTHFHLDINLLLTAGAVGEFHARSLGHKLLVSSNAGIRHRPQSIQPTSLPQKALNLLDCILILPVRLLPRPVRAPRRLPLHIRPDSRQVLWHIRDLIKAQQHGNLVTILVLTLARRVACRLQGDPLEA